MIEVLWHGRGGQGAFTAAKLLGAAYSLQGPNHYALAFPSFGPERRGAPIRAFTKLDHLPLQDRSEVINPDYTVYLDDTLFSSGILRDSSPDHRILVNTKKTFDDPRIVAFDGDAIATEILGMPISNTVMLAVFASVYHGLSFEAMETAVELYMPPKLVPKNKLLIQEVRHSLRSEEKF